MNEREGVGVTPNRRVPACRGGEMTLKVRRVCYVVSLFEVFFLFCKVQILKLFAVTDC